MCSVVNVTDYFIGNKNIPSWFVVAATQPLKLEVMVRFHQREPISSGCRKVTGSQPALEAGVIMTLEVRVLPSWPIYGYVGESAKSAPNRCDEEKFAKVEPATHQRFKDSEQGSEVSPLILEVRVLP